MARAQVTAPPSPGHARAARVRELAGKGAKRTPAERDELLDLLAQRVADLEAHIGSRSPQV